MSDETNRSLVEDYINAWSSADVSKLERLLDASFTYGNPPPGYTGDKKGAIAMSQAFHVGFPDLKSRCTDWIVQGDRVAVRFVGTGTHKGDFMGTPASGKKTETTGLALVTVANGRITSDVTEFDALGLLTQIGAIPEATPEGESGSAGRPPRPSRAPAGEHDVHVASAKSN